MIPVDATGMIQQRAAMDGGAACARADIEVLPKPAVRGLRDGLGSEHPVLIRMDRSMVSHSEAPAQRT